MGAGGAGPRTLGSERHYFGENFSRTLGWERALGQGPGLGGGRKMEGRAGSSREGLGRGWGLRHVQSGTGDRSCRRRGGCECRGGVRVGSGAVLHVGGPLPGAAGRDLGSVRGGAKPDFLPGPSAPPPSGVPRRAAQGRSQAPSSGPARSRSTWPAGFLPSALRTSRSSVGARIPPTYPGPPSSCFP